MRINPWWPGAGQIKPFHGWCGPHTLDLDAYRGKFVQISKIIPRKGYTLFFMSKLSCIRKKIDKQLLFLTHQNFCQIALLIILRNWYNLCLVFTSFIWHELLFILMFNFLLWIEVDSIKFEIYDPTFFLCLDDSSWVKILEQFKHTFINQQVVYIKG